MHPYPVVQCALWKLGIHKYINHYSLCHPYAAMMIGKDVNKYIIARLMGGNSKKAATMNLFHHL